MPRIRDKDKIRSLLNADRIWSAYALADLSPGFYEQSEWLFSGESIALLFNGFDAPLLFTRGTARGVEQILNEISCPKLYLSVRDEVMQLIRRNYRIDDEELMLRMVLEATPEKTNPDSRCCRLGPSDLPAIKQLFADAALRHDAPQFFENYMVEKGVFFGIYNGSELIAVAGTHLVAYSEDVAAIGCVYTRADHRGLALSTVVTGAVVEQLRRETIGTVVLNVKKTNAAAVRVYEKLGFKAYCEFYEGTAHRQQ